MLQKAGADAPLRAADDLPASNHQFVSRWRHKAGGIASRIGHFGLTGIGGQNGGNSKLVVAKAKRFGDPLVISIDRVAESGGIIRNNGVCEFVIMQDGPATRWTM